MIAAPRRDGRAVQGARLESVFTERCRGFESHSLRQSLSPERSLPPDEREKIALFQRAFPQRTGTAATAHRP